jgi:DNA-binding response OmpR family regulator
MKLLLIEIESRTADFLRRGFGAMGWFVQHAPDAVGGLALASGQMFDVLILERALPGPPGLVPCRTLRARGVTTPLLMLSDLDGPLDRIEGLQGGADDYLGRPFDFGELTARVEALHRRNVDWCQRTLSPLIDCDGIVYDREAMTLQVDGVEVALSGKEREVLHVLMAERGRVISREKLLNLVWGVTEDPLTNVVNVYLARLRRKLGRHGSRLVALRGVGYRLV